MASDCPSGNLIALEGVREPAARQIGKHLIEHTQVLSDSQGQARLLLEAIKRELEDNPEGLVLPAMRGDAPRGDQAHRKTVIREAAPRQTGELVWPGVDQAIDRLFGGDGAPRAWEASELGSAGISAAAALVGAGYFLGHRRRDRDGKSRLQRMRADGGAVILPPRGGAAKRTHARGDRDPATAAAMAGSGRRPPWESPGRREEDRGGCSPRRKHYSSSPTRRPQWTLKTEVLSPPAGLGFALPGPPGAQPGLSAPWPCTGGN